MPILQKFSSVWKGLIVFAVLTVCHTVFAVSIYSPTNALPGSPASGDKSFNTGNIEEKFPAIITYFIGIIGVLAIIVITWAGIEMFLSVGQEEKFKKAKNTLIYALVGVGLAGWAFIIVNVVSNLSF